MTDTKTKPDGWVQEDYREVLSEDDGATVVASYRAASGGEVPVCLVPPALLDWCEEVEEFLKKTLDHCILNGYGEIASEERDLLNKLKEVRK